MSELRVHLVGYPVKLGARLDEHVADWLREFKLMAFAARGTAERTSEPLHHPPERLIALADQLRRVYAREMSEPERMRQRAYAEGRATVDVSVPIVPKNEALVHAWQDMMRQVDEFCVDQELLTLARPLELRQLSEWIFGEFIRQLHGEPALPWNGPLQ